MSGLLVIRAMSEQAEAEAPRNQFGAWLDNSGYTADQVAGWLKVTRAFVYLLRSGDKKPGLSLALRIDSLTGGRVPPRAWE